MAKINNPKISTFSKIVTALDRYVSLQNIVHCRVYLTSEPDLSFMYVKDEEGSDEEVALSSRDTEDIINVLRYAVKLNMPDMLQELDIILDENQLPEMKCTCIPQIMGVTS